MTALLVAPITESRPRAHRWQAAPLALAPPGQPTLDLRPAVEPMVLAPPADHEEPTTPGLPDAQAWSVALATRVLEVLVARRTLGQLSRWVSEDVLTELEEQLPRLRQARSVASVGRGDQRRTARGRPPAVRLQSVRLQYPRTGAVEVSVHARLGTRSVACAIRLEAQPGRWLCTALELAPGGGHGEPDPT